MIILATLLIWAVRIYILAIFVHVLGSYVQQWRREPWYQVVEVVVQPYLSLFRALPLQSGPMDFTPMVAVIVLAIFERLLQQAAGG